LIPFGSKHIGAFFTSDNDGGSNHSGSGTDNDGNDSDGNSRCSNACCSAPTRVVETSADTAIIIEQTRSGNPIATVTSITVTVAHTAKIDRADTDDASIATFTITLRAGRTDTAKIIADVEPFGRVGEPVAAETGVVITAAKTAFIITLRTRIFWTQAARWSVGRGVGTVGVLPVWRTNTNWQRGRACIAAANHFCRTVDAKTRNANAWIGRI